MANARGKSKGRKTSRQAKSTALNKKYRAEAAKLKRLGILSSRVNARANISRSTRTKINKFRDVLEGKAIAVRAKPEIRKQYSDKGILPERGAFLIAPKQFEKEKAKISRGMVTMERHLKNGQWEYVILPIAAHDLPDLIESIRRNDSQIDKLKYDDEQFGFRLFGHNSNDLFYDAQDLADNLQHYVSKFANAKTNPIQFLTFQRFKGFSAGRGELRPRGGEKRYYSTRTREGRREEPEGTLTRQRRERDKLKHRKARAKETPEQRKIRLEKNRIRAAQWRQRKLLED